MKNFYIQQSSSAQTSFANLNTAVLNAEVDRSIENLPGNFASKTVKGRLYWYYQAQMPDGIPMQIYVGPDSDNIKQLIGRKQTTNIDLAQQRAHLTKLSKSCSVLGCQLPAISHGRVIKKLADFGFFRSGGILAGTHAFLAYQNYLGITWTSGNTTMDIDFTHAGKSMSIALPATLIIDTHKAIESLEMGFFPVADHAKYIKKDEQDFVLDFLTTVGKSGMDPIFSKQLNIQLQPLKFMEISIEDPLQTILLTQNGSVLINLPQPERFAVHKLIVQGERKNQPLKSTKDVIQATAIITWLLENNPDTLIERIIETKNTGPGWNARLTQGFNAMQNKFPIIYDNLIKKVNQMEQNLSIPRRG